MKATNGAEVKENMILNRLKMARPKERAGKWQN